MSVNGAQMIGAVLDHLRPEDVELLLANRGLPSAGCKEDLADRLQSALQAEICEWEWESGDVPEFHCGMTLHAKTPQQHGFRSSRQPSCAYAGFHTHIVVFNASLYAG